MSDILLKLKLVMPPPRPSLVSRPRIIEKANQGLGGQLILISAPAGFGKTTFVVDWLSQLAASRPQRPNYHIGWLSLDETDNDFARFMAYVVAAVRKGVADQTWGEGVRVLAQASDHPVHASASLLMNEVADLDGSLILVLDDYHLIHQAAIHQAIAYLLDHQPSNLKLVLITRAEPPLPLARLRLRGHLCELQTVDMRFSSAETADFFRITKGISLSPNQVATLDARAEGWVAGLQAAALSLQGSQDVDRFLEAFSGRQRFVLDYMAEEVYRQQPEAIQSFLRQTAVCSRFCAPLCEAVMAIERAGLATDVSPLSDPDAPASAQATIEYLDAANLFVVPLDDQRRWYRYHHLFRDFLHSQLAQTEPEQIPALHRRAAAWYVQNGMVDEAIQHSLSAGDDEWAAVLIAANARTKLMHGERGTLQRWLDALPKELIHSNPHLCLAQATALTFVRDIEGVDTYLDAAETAVAHAPELAPSEEGKLLGAVAVYRAMIALWEGRSEQTTRLCQEALVRLRGQDSYLTGLASLLLGMTHQRRDLSQARAAFARALDVGRDTGDVMLANTAAGTLAEVCVRQGKLHQAADQFHEAIAIASDKKKRPFPLAAAAFIGLAQIAREWNKLDEANDYLAQATALAQSAGLRTALLEARFTHSLLHWARGNWEQALASLSDGENLAQSHLRPDVSRRLAAFRARLALARGQMDEAASWARSCGLSVHDEPSERDEPRYLILAGISIAQAREHTDIALLDQVIRLLSRLEEKAVATGRVHSQISILVLQSLAYDVREASPLALSPLQKALALAEPGGYVRLFADEGKPLAKLLRQLAPTASSRLLLYIGEISAAIQEPLDATFPLVEPLTGRELEVLQLIVAGLSNREIADALVIALSTVKRHINHIYGKLDVSSRTQAVARARDLKLLS